SPEGWCAHLFRTGVPLLDSVAKGAYVVKEKVRVGPELDLVQCSDGVGSCFPGGRVAIGAADLREKRLASSRRTSDRSSRRSCEEADEIRKPRHLASIGVLGMRPRRIASEQRTASLRANLRWKYRTRDPSLVQESIRIELKQIRVLRFPTESPRFD